MPGDVEDIEATPPVLESEFVSADDKEDGSIAKQALMAEMSGGMGGPRPDKAAIGEILLALEARNPTPSPATSELLNGKWKVLYATGASPGLKALTLLLKGAEKASSPPAPRTRRAHPATRPATRPAPAQHPLSTLVYAPCLQAPKSPSGAELVDVQDTYITIQAEQPRVEAATKAPLPRTLTHALTPHSPPPASSPWSPSSPVPPSSSRRPHPCAPPAPWPQVRVLSLESTAKLLCRLEAESAVRPTLTLDSHPHHPHPTLPPSPPSPYTPTLTLTSPSQVQA